MKIAVDARPLTLPLTGIGQYTFEICKTLASRDDVSLFLYTPSTLITHFFSDKSIRNKQWHNPFLRQLWPHFVIPAWVKQDKIDLFWGPGHRLPFRLPREVAAVVTIHDLVSRVAPWSMSLPNRILESIYLPAAVKRADHIVTVSHASKKLAMQTFHLTENHITSIHSGGRMQTTIPHAMTTSRKPYFLFVGTLEPRKNLIRLLEAFAALPAATREKANLVIAGGKGWGEVNLSEKILALKLANHVELLGYVDDETLSCLYANCLFLAMPSLYEGFGLPIVEALSFGKPILTANNSSMPEVAGPAGLLVEATDTQDIKAGLEKMINDIAFRDSLAANAKPHAAQFNWEHTTTKLLDVFQSVLNRKRAS